MLEALLPARHCQWCGGDISQRKKSAKFCSDEHRLRDWGRRHPTSRPIRGEFPLYNGNRGRRRCNRARPKTRYAIVQLRGAVMEVLAFDSATSKRAVERAFGISERPDLAAIAARHLPSLSTCSQ